MKKIIDNGQPNGQPWTDKNTVHDYFPIYEQEFDKIFRDIFGKRANDYKQIVQKLADGSCEVGELCKKLEIESTGGFSKKLHVLQQSGFLARDFVWGKSQKKSKKKKWLLTLLPEFCYNCIRV